MLTTLVDRSRAPELPLPAPLLARYGGGLGFSLPNDRPHVFANFVTTLDGLVSFALPGRSAARLVSAGNADDRFMLGFLRACADAVVVGVGTLRVERDGLWTPESAFPDAGPDFAALRKAMGKPPRPLPTFVTRSGEIDLDAPVFGSGDEVLVLTTRRGAVRLARAPKHVRVRAITDAERPSAREIVNAVVGETGARLVLTEGGPTVLGQFLRERLLDELFLTIAPQLAGRSAEERRLGLVEGAAFEPAEAPWADMVSVKQAGDYLFLRLALRPRPPG